MPDTRGKTRAAEPGAADGRDPGPKLKGQARLGAERRQAILDAAVDVFGTQGFNGGSLSDVAERIGASPPLILYHFGSKEGLLQAVLEERDRVHVRLIEGLAGIEVVEMLRSLVIFAEASRQHAGHTALFTTLQAESLDPGSPAHAYFLERSRGVRGLLARALEEGRRRAEIRTDTDPEAVARGIFAMMEGAAILSLIDPTVSLVDIYRDYIEQLIASLTDGVR